MKLKLFFVFLLTVLIPTFLLIYFSLLAVRGEKDFLEKSMQQKYEVMAQIIAEDIETSLKNAPKALRADPKTIEPLLFKNTLLFKDEVMIFDRHGQAVDGVRRREDFGIPAYQTAVADLPYEIAVYERYPVILEEIKTIKLRVSRHLGVVGLSALAILLGGLLTLGELLRRWRKTEIKEEFISHLVHDLKRPLTSIRMFSEMLENDRVQNEEKRKEYYRIISAESEKLEQLARNVLDFSRIESRRLRYEKKPEDIAALVHETVERFRSNLMMGKTHQITLDVLHHPLPLLDIDAGSISQALINLLSNAVKYSPAGSRIRVVLSKTKNRIILSVGDEGIGVPKKEMISIFREYYRGERLEVKNREGIGLGLALVQHTVLAHRGNIKVNSEEGRGSEFQIALPIN
jgi:two-component system phosphate regulon sensor histidine kinase PhoR